jgi:hypothetical protein
MVESIKQLMVEFREQVLVHNSISWYAWVKKIQTEGSPYYQEFCSKLADLDEMELKSIYTKFRTCPPTIIFDDIVKKFKIFYKSLYGVEPIIGAKPNLNTIIKLLGYTLVVEVVVPDYLVRINTHFGWG